MENKQEYYSCFRYYTKKGRRVSAFARIIEEERMEIFIWECSKKDKFDKKIAKKIYEEYLSNGYNLSPLYCSVLFIRMSPHPKIFTLPIGDLGVKATFLSYLSDNYYKPFPIWKVTRYKYLNKKELQEAYSLVNNMIL